MNKSVITLGLILTLGSMLVSCSHQTSTEKGSTGRYLASEGCPTKGEYHSYFDEAEKCLEKEQDR